MRAWVALAACACACGARTELGVREELDAAHDVAIDHHDADTPDAPNIPDVSIPDVSVPETPAICDYGTIVADVFGSVVYWNNGFVPAGHYRVTYVDGCMKYSSSQDWSVNAYANGPDTLFIVTSNATLGAAPGTVGFIQGQGGFKNFDDCVSANLANDVPFEFDWSGGSLGLALSDNPYTDNVAGENGRSPTYRLSSCP